MTLSRRACLLLAAGIFVPGLLTGIFVQRRWPVGRWAEDRGPAFQPAPVDAANLARLPRPRRLVLVLAGQSNAANYGSVRADGGPGVYAWHRSSLFQARDPLPGADQYRGSVWTRLGAMLRLTGQYDAVVLVALAQGGSHAADWAPGGRWHARLLETLHELRKAGLPPDFMLWQQGESESGTPAATGRDYLSAMTALIASTRETCPDASWVIARATYAEYDTGNAQIREAQRLAAALPGAFPGPDLDVLDAAYRSDGVHFNGPGLEAAARLWREALDPLLARRAHP